MREVRRTFHVGRKGFTRPLVLRSTHAGYWRTSDGVLFMHLGHTWLGQPGERYKIEKWAAPHTDRTFSSLQSALNDWARVTQETEKSAEKPEKKTTAQLDSEIAAALTEGTARTSHATRGTETLPWKKVSMGIYHATSPWGLYVIDGGGAGRNRWTVTYPDGDYGMVDSLTEAKAWAAQDAEARAKRGSAHATRQAHVGRILSETARRKSR